MSEARLIAEREGDRVPFEVTAAAPVTLGRSAQATVTLPDPIVSRQHCRLHFESGALVLTDLDSSNGTWFEGERVDRRQLRPGDCFRIGGTEVRLADRAYEEPPTGAQGGSAPEQSAGSGGDEALLGEELGGYRITGVLGAGGYAVVYRAEQVQLGREVALKVLRHGPEGAAPDRVAAFLREARAAAALNHPSLVHVFDVGEVSGRYYLSMELVAGGSLAQRLRADGALPWRDAVPILRDVAAALQCAHEHGLVHRDVKPGNVLLTRDGRAKLVDLGLAADTAGADKVRAGTVQFMAPEQIRGQKIDARADLYSLGCTAFALLAGTAPFARSATTAKAVLVAHVRQEPDSLRDRGVQLPQELDRLVARLLAKAPEDRPEDAAEVHDALAQVVAGAAAPVRSRRRHRARRHRQGASSRHWGAFALLFVVLAAALAALAWWQYGGG